MKNLNYAILDQAVVSGVNFITSIILVRHIGLEEYGKYAIAWMIIVFFNALQQAAINNPMMSIAPKEKDGKECGYYGSVFMMQLVWSTGNAFMAFILLYVINIMIPSWNLNNHALPLSVTVFTWQCQDFIRRYFFSRGFPQKAIFNDIISYCGQLMAILVFMKYININSVSVLWIVSFTSGIAVIAGLKHCDNVKFVRSDFKIHLSRNWLFSKWMLLSAMMKYLVENIYLFIAGIFMGPVAVGGVKAVQNIIGVLHILFMAIENVLPVGAGSSLKKGGKKQIKKYIDLSIYYGLGFTVFAVSVIWILSGFLVDIIYGKEFVKYAFILKWFCVMYVFEYLNYPLRIGLRSLEKTKPIFISMLVPFILSVCIATWLVKTYEYHGVMFGIVLGKVLTVMILFYSYRRIIRQANHQ